MEKKKYFLHYTPAKDYEGNSPNQRGRNPTPRRGVGGSPENELKVWGGRETPITADTALRLARYFGTTPAFWMGMQAQYELERAQDMLAAELKRISPLKQAAA